MRSGLLATAFDTFYAFAFFGSSWATLFSGGVLAKVIRVLTARRMIQCATPTHVMQNAPFL